MLSVVCDKNFTANNLNIVIIHGTYIYKSNCLAISIYYYMYTREYDFSHAQNMKYTFSFLQVSLLRRQYSVSIMQFVSKEYAINMDIKLNRKSN